MSLHSTKNVTAIAPLLNDTGYTAVDAVLSTSISSDGAWCSAATTFGAVHLFPMQSSRCAEHHIEVEETPSSEVLPASPQSVAPPFSFNPSSLGDDQAATTCARFAPKEGLSDEYRILVCQSDGFVEERKLNLGGERAQAQLWKVRAGEAGNQNMVCEYAPSGAQFAVGGSDCVLRLFDIAQDGATIVRTFEQAMGVQGEPGLGHGNKIMAAKFANTNLLVSGGWETSALLWDLRQKNAVRSFKGTYVTGDGLDVIGQNLLTVSERPESQVRVFDIGTGIEKFRPITVDCLGITGRLFQNSNSLCAWVAGKQTNSIFALDLSAGRLLASVTDMEHPIFSLSLHPASPGTIVVGGGNHTLNRLTTDFSLKTA